MKKDVQLCFSEIIEKRGWYLTTHDDRKKASLHKRKFIEGSLGIEIIRTYLENSGYECTQRAELWKKKDIKDGEED